MNKGKIFAKFIILSTLYLFSILAVMSCGSNVRSFTINPRYDKYYDKVLIVKPYIQATVRNRVFDDFSIFEFTLEDENAFYKSVISSIEDAKFFKEVVVAETNEIANETEGNVYLKIKNNVASVWQDNDDKLYYRFNTTITFGVSNNKYFSKTYDATESSIFKNQGRQKKKVFKQIIKELFVDLEEESLQQY